MTQFDTVSKVHTLGKQHIFSLYLLKILLQISGAKFSLILSNITCHSLLQFLKCRILKNNTFFTQYDLNDELNFL